MSTSRVGRKPIVIPKGVEIKLQGHDLSIKGTKGHMSFPLHPSVTVEIDNGSQHLKFIANDEGYCRAGTGSKLKKSIVGTMRAKINNLVQGVSVGFERKLQLVGVGYRAQANGGVLTLTVGFSHPVVIHAPEGVSFQTPSQTEIIVKGIDRHLVGHTAAKIRAVRCPEPYKGKGIRYIDEIIIRKETKKK